MRTEDLCCRGAEEEREWLLGKGGREGEKQVEHARSDGGCSFISGGTCHGGHRRLDLHEGGRHFQNKKGGGVVKGEEAE